MRTWIVAIALMGLALRPVMDVRLPGAPTRLDYQSLDSQKHRLYIAHLGDGDVIVFDTKTNRVLATVPNVSDVHGVLAVPNENALFASATGTNQIVAFDERTLRELWRAPGGTYPDGLAYDPVTRRLFVSDERGRTETVIDTKLHRRIATIPLGGEAGNTQYDAVSHHMFVNVQTAQQLVEIDPRRNEVVGRFSVAGTGCAGNHGLLIDARRRRAFVACEDSNSLLWLDLRKRVIVQTWTVGDGPDVLALDTKSDRLFVATESGTVSTFVNGERVKPLGQAFLAANAHTVAVDSDAHLVYFPLEDAGGVPVLRIMADR